MKSIFPTSKLKVPPPPDEDLSLSLTDHDKHIVLMECLGGYLRESHLNHLTDSIRYLVEWSYRNLEV
jgi:hypothetical protein